MRTCPKNIKANKINHCPLCTEDVDDHLVGGYLEPNTVFGPTLLVKPYNRVSQGGVFAGISVMFESDSVPTDDKKVWVDVTANCDHLAHMELKTSKKGICDEEEPPEEKEGDVQEEWSELKPFDPEAYPEPPRETESIPFSTPATIATEWEPLFGSFEEQQQKRINE